MCESIKKKHKEKQKYFIEYLIAALEKIVDRKKLDSWDRRN
ncbi:unnamed protein product, partial [marine sediment metagenome]